MDAGHISLPSDMECDFDAASLQEIDFLEPKLEDITLSQICDQLETENNVFESLNDLSLTEMMDKYEPNDLGQFHVALANAIVGGGQAEKPQSKRFADPVNDADIKKLIDGQENKNTKKNTAWAFGVFRNWRNNRNIVNPAKNAIIPELCQMSPEDMNFYLGRFVLEARKTDGKEYPPKSLYLICCGLLRHLKDSGIYDRNFLDTNDVRFVEFRKILDSKMKELLARGFGTKVKQAEAIFPEDEEIIWEKGVFGAKNAETLQCTVFFYACKIFGLRGHDEHHDLMCDQFNLGEDANGKYVEFTGRSTKTYKGGLAQLELANKVVRHHCQPGERCIADYFRVHLEALGNNGKFYRRPLPGNPPRYGNQPVGVNKLKNMIKIICLRAGMEGNYTNHSGKRTCATQLYLAGVDEQDIMSRTGHRSEKAVRKYKQSCSTVTKRVSKVLDPPAAKGSENDPPTAKGSENDESSSAKVRKIETPSTSENVKVPFSDITSRAYFNNCQISFNVDSKAK